MHGIMKVAVEKFKALPYTPLSSTLNIRHDRILDVSPIVYNTTLESDRGLRDPLTSCLAEQWEIFTKLPRFKSDTADLGFDLFIAKCREKCSGCNKVSKQTEKNRYLERCNFANRAGDKRIFPGEMDLPSRPHKGR